eukprot:COSAG05_NODE_1664_length_4313_cov_152.642145_3_plen_95_part_00
MSETRRARTPRWKKALDELFNLRQAVLGRTEFSDDLKARHAWPLKSWKMPNAPGIAQLRDSTYYLIQLGPARMGRMGWEAAYFPVDGNVPAQPG